MNACERLNPLDPKPLLTAAGNLLGECWSYGRITFARRSARPPARRIHRLRPGAPKVLVLPGLTASDATMRPLRDGLRQAGFRAYRWGLGRNLGVTGDLLDRLDRRVGQLQDTSDERIILVGWSLGGLIAREYAKRAPDKIAAVVTLGSPFSGDPGRMMVARVYEWIAGHRVDSPPIRCTLSQKPPVPTAAIWSARDGVVPAMAARGNPDEADHRIEVGCAHIAYPCDPRAIAAVIDAIGRCRGELQPRQTRSRAESNRPARSVAASTVPPLTPLPAR